MKKLLIISGVVLFFASCKSDSGWTDESKAKIRKTCTDGMGGRVDEKVATAYCDCILEQAMKKYKNAEELDKKGTEDEGRSMGMNCISTLKPAMEKPAEEPVTDTTSH